MRFIIFSDGHIGLGEPKADKKKVAKIIEVSKDYDKTIFNGDMIETWKYGKLGWKVSNRKDKAEDILYIHKNLKNFMISDETIVLLGNHDYALKDLMETEESIVITSNDFKTSYYITHGNNCSKETSFDYIKRSNSWWVITTAWISSIVSKAFTKLFKKDVAEGEEILNKIYTSFKENSDKNVMNDYIFTLPKHDFYVVGHTHKKGRYLYNKDNENRRCFNTGHCVGSHLDAVTIDTETKEIKTIRIDVEY